MTDWFETSLGSALLAQEREHCLRLVPSGYYPSSLQVGRSSLNFLAGVESGARFFIGEHAMKTSAETETGDSEQPIHSAISKPSAMPFADRTHNLLILPHTLDFCDDAHAVLREVQHILAPEGCVVITGFNPLSLWGVAHLMLKASHRRPWSGHYCRIGRMQDWLSLLGFELIGAAMLAYQPPLQSEKWRRKLNYLDQAGARWWPGLGAVYVIVGRKKEIAVSARGVTKMHWGQFLPGMAQPAARVELKLVRQKMARNDN